MAYEITVEPLITSGRGFVGNLLEGLIAFGILVVVLAIGLFVANLLGQILREFFSRLKLEKFLESHGVHDAFVGFTFTGIAVALLKLYVMVAFLGIAADIVKIGLIATLAMQAMNYLPSLLQGLIIVMAALMAGDYITDKMKESKKIPFANSVAIAVELFIAYNALVIAMPMLLPAADPSLLVWSFLVLLSALAIALGLGAAIAIGLGMKDTVADVAKKHKDKFHKLL
jgi:hypothetical protein